MRNRDQILRPKLGPPRPWRGRIERPRLLARLDQALLAGFTLVSAPAGYGKTTLLAQWVHQVDVPFAWLTLDEGDNELTVFLENLIAAAKTVDPDSCPSTQSLLSRPGLPPVELLTRELADDLANMDEFVLVLDDAHHLKDPRILAILRHLVYQPPVPLHLILSSRADPMLPLGALRGRGLVSEIRGSDLRFTETEAVAYLQQALSEPLSESQVRSLLERTEGWIAGLHLAALSLRGRDDVAERISAFAGENRFITDYLMEELLASLDPTIRHYLMTTSILRRLCAPLCEAVMGESSIDTVEGRPVLEWLQESNLFVFSLDDRRTWFRYHQLFRELLRHLLDVSSTKDEVATLHVRAAGWLGANRHIDRALGHLLEAERTDLACELIEKERQAAIDQERWRDLERWLRMLGPAVSTRPRLVMIHAWLAHQRADWADLRRQCDAIEQLLDEQEPPLEDDEELRGETAVMRAQLSYWRGEGDLTVSHARRALALLSPEFRLARATAMVFEGGGLQLLGRGQEAFQAYRRGSSTESGTVVHPRVMIGSGWVALMTGELDYARHVGDLLLSQSTDQGLKDSAGYAHYFLGMVAYLRNGLPEAEQHFEQVDPYASHVVAAKQSLYGLAWVRQAQGRPEDALAVMDGALSFITDLDIPLVPEVTLLRARLAALPDPSGADLTLPRSLLPPADAILPTLHVCHEYSAVSAIAMLLQGTEQDLTDCEQLVLRLLATAEATDNVFRSIQGSILQALAYDRRGQRADSLAAIDRAVALAKPGRYIRLFPEMGERVSALLETLQIERTDPFLAELMGSFTGRGLGPAPSRAPRSSVPRGDIGIEFLLTNRELDVLEFLEQRLSNKEIARKLSISPATVKRHTLSIYSKLGVNGRREATVKAAQLGLLPTRQYSTPV